MTHPGKDSPQLDIELKTSPVDDALMAAMDRWAAGGASSGGFEQRLELPRPWRATPDQISLDVSYRFQRGARGTALTAEVSGHRVALDAPVKLKPARIPKPWGQEIWYTGIEARGESAVATDQGQLPLSQYLALAPRLLCGKAPMTLLKVLDPHPEPVVGDLYFELHEVKREVYVVTHVHPDAWPSGTGAIRFGMNQTLRREYHSDAAFRRAYLEAVRAYESVRRAIDEGTETPDPARGRALAAEERRLREAMERFTEVRPLRVGDVVVVPNWVPHSLQHGVRVVEFQTPTYERRIISFGQRVLTQSHWDSETAIMGMTLDLPSAPSFERADSGWERLVRFEDFSVWRGEIPPGGELELPAHPSYALCMAVGGPLRLGSLALAGEQAAFVPGWLLGDRLRRPVVSAAPRTLTSGDRDASGTQVLLAAPDL